jgi:hypothetical protein
MARPKKRVLLVCSNEIVLSDLIVKVKVWGYAVEAAKVEGAIHRVREDAFDLVILVSNPDPREWNAFTQAALDIQDIQFHRHSDTRIFDPYKTLPLEIAMCVPRIFGSSAQFEYLRSAIALSAQRKRGPRAPILCQYLPVGSVA